MKSVGLISEYNPFHNGHLYHAQQSKLQSDAEINYCNHEWQFRYAWRTRNLQQILQLRWLYQVLI